MCPRRVSGNCRNSRLYFLDFLSVALLTETAGHHGRKKWDKVKQCPKFLPHQSRSGPLKGTDKTCGTIIAPCLCKINTAAYIRGLYHSYFIFHLLHTVSDKKKKSLQFQNSMNYWFHSHNSYSPPTSPCPLSFPLFKSATQLLSHSRECSLLEWSLPVNLIILDSSNPSQVASHCFISIGLGQGPSWEKFHPLASWIIKTMPFTVVLQIPVRYSNLTKELFSDANEDCSYIAIFSETCHCSLNWLFFLLTWFQYGCSEYHSLGYGVVNT